MAFKFFSVLFSLSVRLSWRVHTLQSLVGDCHGAPNLCTNFAIMMGMIGPRFLSFQTLLERINAILKKICGVVVKSLYRKKHNLTNCRVLMNFSAKSLYRLCLLSYRTHYDASRLWSWSSLSIWLVAGMAPVRSVWVGSIASFINYLQPDYLTIIMVGF